MCHYLHKIDVWNLRNPIGGICSLPVQTLEEVVEGIFNVAACERIIYITDKFISDEARAF